MAFAAFGPSRVPCLKGEITALVMPTNGITNGPCNTSNPSGRGERPPAQGRRPLLPPPTSFLPCLPQPAISLRHWRKAWQRMLFHRIRHLRRPCSYAHPNLSPPAERVLGLLKNPLFGHFPGIASPALGLGCLPRGKSFGARADLFWHGGSGLLALLVHPGRPVFNTLLHHN